MSIRLWLCLLAALAGAPHVLALDQTKSLSQFSYQTWQTENGLPQNTVQTILQSHDGYVWLGTEGGLVRFDGLQFTVFDSRNTPGLRSNDIRSLMEDGSGALWVGTADGLCRWGGLQTSRFGKEDGLPGDSVLALYTNLDGKLWVVMPDGLAEAMSDQKAATVTFRSYVLSDSAARLTGALAFSPDRVPYVGSEAGVRMLQKGRIVDVNETAKALGSAPVTGLLFDRSSRLWIGTSKGIWKSDAAAISNLRPLAGCSEGRVSALLEDRDGNVWVGSAAGLNRLENGTCSARPALAGKPVIAVTEDAEGDMWAGTEAQGVTIARDQKFFTYAARDGLVNDAVRCVFQDRGGAVWVGTSDGLTRIQGAQFTTWTTKEGLSSNVILSLGEDAKGDLLIGTPDGLDRIHGSAVSVLTSADGLADDFVRSIFRDRDGTLWIGTRRGLSHYEHGSFKTYTQADGLGSDLVGAVMRDRLGDLWIGTLRGLSRIHGDKLENYGISAGLSSQVITALLEDALGNLWIGTQDGGLNLRRDGKFVRVSQIENLPKAVYGIAEDSYGNLWMSTSTGIARANRDEVLRAAATGQRRADVSWYGTSDGLLVSDCSSGGHPAIWKASDGAIWFATVKGLAMVDANATKLNRVPPPVRLESVSVDDRSFAPHEAFQIDAGHSRIAFDYAGLSFAAPQKVQYKYRLEHFDKSWIAAGTRRTAYYTNVPPGHYSFQVIARNNDGFWSRAPAAFQLTLKPAFHQTYWFYTAIAALAGLMIFVIYRWRVAEVQTRFQAVLQERNRIAREIHDTLAQGFVGVSVQLEIVSRLLESSAAGAREHLDQARIQVRDSIAEARRSIWQLRSQSTDSEDLGSRLSKAARQCIGSRSVKVTVEVHGTNRRLDAKTEDELLRIASEAIVNAVKHGTPQQIRVVLAFEAKKLRLSVTDDGKGFDAGDAALSTNGHYGLKGMRERAEQIRATLSVDSQAGKGTTVVVEARLN